MKTSAWKKLLAAAMVIATLFMMAGCTAPAQEDSGTDDSLQKVLDSGKLVVAIESSWAPYCFMEGEELKGIYAEFWEVICEELGVEPEWFTSSSYDSLISATDSGRVAVLYSFTIGSSDKFIYSEPFAQTIRALTVAKDSDITCWEDLEGKLCANALGGSNAKVAMLFGAEVTKATIDEAMLLITQGRADCQVEDVISLAYFLNAKPEIAEQVKQVDYYSDPNLSFEGAAFLPDQVALRDRISEIITEKVDDGTFFEIISNWSSAESATNMAVYEKFKTN